MAKSKRAKKAFRTDAGNYAAQAELGLRRWLASNDKDYLPTDRGYKAFVADGIRDAVHFVMPDEGLIFKDGLAGLRGIGVPRLPFPAITVEYFVSKESQSPSTKDEFQEYAVASCRRVALAVEVSSDLFFEQHWQAWEGNRVSRVSPGSFEPLSDLYLQIFAVNHFEGVGWLLHPLAAGVAIGSNSVFDVGEDGCSLTGESLKEVRANLRPSDVMMRVSTFPVCPDYLREFVSKSGVDSTEIFRRLDRDMGQEALAVLELLEALTCTNVKISTFAEGLDTRINQKRGKLGKMPFYESKFLTLTDTVRGNGPSVSAPDRRGPRQHLRRGHIRRMSSGKNVWVNSCVVGSAHRGVIDKVYNIPARA